MSASIKQFVLSPRCGTAVTLHADGSVFKKSLGQSGSEWSEVATSTLGSRAVAIQIDDMSRVVVLTVDGKLHVEQAPQPGRFNAPESAWADLPGPFDPVPEPTARAAYAG